MTGHGMAYLVVRQLVDFQYSRVTRENKNAVSFHIQDLERLTRVETWFVTLVTGPGTLALHSYISLSGWGSLMRTPRETTVSIRSESVPETRCFTSTQGRSKHCHDGVAASFTIFSTHFRSFGVNKVHLANVPYVVSQLSLAAPFS